MLLSGDHVKLGKYFFLFTIWNSQPETSFYCYKENIQSPLDV